MLASRLRRAMAMLLMLAVGLPLLAAAQPVTTPRTLRGMADCCARMGHQCPPARTGQQRNCCQQLLTAPQPAALTATAEMHAPAVVVGLAAASTILVPLPALRQPDLGPSPPLSPPRSVNPLRI